MLINVHLMYRFFIRSLAKSYTLSIQLGYNGLNVGIYYFNMKEIHINIQESFLMGYT
jgi:hypothetical protein